MDVFDFTSLTLEGAEVVRTKQSSLILVSILVSTALMQVRNLNHLMASFCCRKTDTSEIVNTMSYRTLDDSVDGVLRLLTCY